MLFRSERLNVKTGAFAAHFTYTDQERDDESGLMYYGARYYHPTLGRFTQPDPVIVDTGRKEFRIALLNPQTFNPYSYVANNPLKLVDPTGEAGNQFGVVFDYASEGARAVGQDLQNSAENWRAQVNPLSVNRGSTAWGVTSYTVAEGLDMVGGMFGNAQKVLDPESPSSQKAFAGAMLSLDLAGGGKWKAAEGALKFGQKAVSNTFTHGEFADKTIGYVVEGLRKGSISPDQLPIQFIVRDGERIAFDNRSFTSLTRAGLNPTKLIDVTGIFDSRI